MNPFCITMVDMEVVRTIEVNNHGDMEVWRYGGTELLGYRVLTYIILLYCSLFVSLYLKGY